MIEILKKEKKSAFLLSNQALSPSVRYKWSVYVLQHEKDNLQYIYNNLSTHLYLIEDGDDVVFDRSRTFGYEEIIGTSALKKLAEDFFLVKADEDEDKLYENFISIMVKSEKRKLPKGVYAYTILPTTACNARCFYCFEQGMKTVTMSEETINAAINYIMQTKCDGHIILNWFGGEPLLRADIIDRFCSEFKKRGVSFKSHITTNGSLITPALAQKIKNDWNTEFVQVSLDGEESEYNRRKAYVNLTGSPYELVMRNIGLLLEQGIFVNLRCNIDENNAGTLNTFMNDLDLRFPDKSNLSLEFVTLYDKHSTPEELELYIKCMDLKETVQKLGFNRKTGEPKFETMVYYCPAQSFGRAMVITPDGKLYVCEHCGEGTEIGTVFEGVTNTAMADKYFAHNPVSKKCSGCFYLPKCTTFDMCPIKNTSQECREIKRNYLVRFLNKTIDKYYREVGR